MGQAITLQAQLQGVFFGSYEARIISDCRVSTAGIYTVTEPISGSISTLGYQKPMRVIDTESLSSKSTNKRRGRLSPVDNVIEAYKEALLARGIINKQFFGFCGQKIDSLMTMSSSLDAYNAGFNVANVMARGVRVSNHSW